MTVQNIDSTKHGEYKTLQYKSLTVQTLRVQHLTVQDSESTKHDSKQN